MTALRLASIPLPDHRTPALTLDDLNAAIMGAAADRSRRRARMVHGAATLVKPEPAEHPDELLHSWVGQLVIGLLEVIRSQRSATQIMKWVSPEVLRSVLRRQQRARARTARHSLRLRRVRVCRVTDVVLEAAAVVYDGVRVQAIALRLEWRDGRWITTALEMG